VALQKPVRPTVADVVMGAALPQDFLSHPRDLRFGRGGLLIEAPVHWKGLLNWQELLGLDFATLVRCGAIEAPA